MLTVGSDAIDCPKLDSYSWQTVTHFMDNFAQPLTAPKIQRADSVIVRTENLPLRQFLFALTNKVWYL